MTGINAADARQRQELAHGTQNIQVLPPGAHGETCSVIPLILSVVRIL